MTPRIVVRYFGPGKQDQWLRMVRVLTWTAQHHVPSWRLDIASVPPDTSMSSPLGVQGNVSNTQKLDLWTAIVEAAPDGDRLLLLDADTVLTAPLDPIWEGPFFDVAYTVKPKGSRFPLNGGVVFLVVSDKTRAFMRAWRDKNRFFLENPMEYQVWRAFYGGLNQTALGVLFRQTRPDLTVWRLPCLEWNCEDEHWAIYTPTVTRIVHYKSALQRAIFVEGTTPDGAKPLVELWRTCEKQAMREGVEAPVTSAVWPTDLENTMVPPETVETPTTPPLSRRQRRRVEQAVREGGQDGHA